MASESVAMGDFVDALGVIVHSNNEMFVTANFVLGSLQPRSL